MEAREKRSEKQINRELLGPALTGTRWFRPAAVVLGLAVIAGLVAVSLLFLKGLGLAGYTRPVMWATFITTFVFWVGISHAGVMISSILRLAQAEWRRPVTRAAELLTIFALATAATLPVIHSGRPWRLVYWFLPYDFERGIWPNIRSPLIWDPAAIFTYLSGAILFVFVAMLPDFALARDRVQSGWRHKLYSTLSLGFIGTRRQWKIQALAGILLSALILPVFVSVHSIVSWDFAVAMGVDGWHATIFAPYFVIGAIHSGVAAVVTIMALMAWLFGWRRYIRPDHFDALGRLQLFVGIGWAFFFLMEFSFGMYHAEGAEVALRQMQVFQWPWSLLFGIFIVTAFFIPITLWMFRKVRRSIIAMFAISIGVNIGMWLERFLIIVPGLARKQPFSFSWGTYAPRPIELVIVAATFAVVLLGLVVFARLFPLIPVYDIKEGQVLHQDIPVGRARVEGVVREEE
ncbi:MAG: polysulfide reductase NrfD [Chloroflexi bacterium]|nr:polysulfide reductase NrfD [Chloroflexota bacterium]